MLTETALRMHRILLPLLALAAPPPAALAALGPAAAGPLLTRALVLQLQHLQRESNKGFMQLQHPSCSFSTCKGGELPITCRVRPPVFQQATHPCALLPVLLSPSSPSAPVSTGGTGGRARARTV